MTTYTSPPSWIVWLIDRKWPIDIVVSFTLWFCLSVFLIAHSSAAPISSVDILGMGMMMGVAGTFYYFLIRAGMHVLAESGCIIGCAWQVALVIGLLYFPTRIISRHIVLPVLTAIYRT